MVTRIQKDVIAVNLLATVRQRSSFRSRKGGSQAKTRKLEIGDPRRRVDRRCFLTAGAPACNPRLEKGNRCCRRFIGCNSIRLGLASLISLAYAGVAPRIVAYRRLNCRSYGARLRLIASLC
eukprot:1934044-Rhodomonas_salina.4